MSPKPKLSRAEFVAGAARRAGAPAAGLEGPGSLLLGPDSHQGDNDAGDEQDRPEFPRGKVPLEEEEQKDQGNQTHQDEYPLEEVDSISRGLSFQGPG